MTGRHAPIIASDIRALYMQLGKARRAYRALRANGHTIAKREAAKAECKRLHDLIEALKCR